MKYNTCELCEDEVHELIFMKFIPIHGYRYQSNTEMRDFVDKRVRVCPSCFLSNEDFKSEIIEVSFLELNDIMNKRGIV